MFALEAGVLELPARVVTKYLEHQNEAAKSNAPLLMEGGWRDLAFDANAFNQPFRRTLRIPYQ